MIRSLFVILFFQALNIYCEEIQWAGSSGKNFTASISMPATTIGIQEILAIQLTLTYPQTTHPRIDELRQNLLAFEGRGSPPFALLEEIKLNPQQTEENFILTQKMIFYLSPQIPGKHFLTFDRIAFDSTSETKTPFAEILSDVFEINVTIPAIDFNPQNLIASPMPLTQELLITIDSENKRKILKNDQQIAQESVKGVKSISHKALPWQILPFFLTILIAFIIIKIAPLPKAKPLPSFTPSDFQIHIKTLKHLDRLITGHLVEKGQKTEFFIGLDSLARVFLEKYYGIKASYTTQEFIKKIRTIPNFDLPLVHFFERADRVKFANYQPTLEECYDAEKVVRKLLSQQPVVSRFSAMTST